MKELHTKPLIKTTLTSVVFKRNITQCHW